MSTINFTGTLTVDFTGVPGNRETLTVFAKQEDSARTVAVTMQMKGVNYTPPSGVEVILRGLKPDGSLVILPCTVSGAVASVPLTPILLAAVGCVRAELCLRKGEEILSSATFYIEVLPSALSSVASGSELSALAKVMEAADRVLNNATLPVACETVMAGYGFSISDATPMIYRSAPTWSENRFVATSTGSVYSSYQTAFSGGYIYFFQGDDRTTYCKLFGTSSGCQGYIRYRLMGAVGASPELTALLDGDAVRGRALPTEQQRDLINDLISTQQMALNSSTYHLVEGMTMAYLNLWIHHFVNGLAGGTAVDFGDGVARRFVSDAEMKEIDRRLSALEG